MKKLLKIFCTSLGLLLLPLAVLAAIYFTDNFNRADSSSVGGSFTEVDTGGILSIASLKMLVSSSADTNSRIYTSAGGVLNNIKMTVRIELTTANATSNSCIGTLGSGLGYDRAFGYCLQIRNGTGNIFHNDNGALADVGDFTYANGTTYDVEIIINTNYSSEIRIWDTSGSRPSTATASSGAETPTAAGTNWHFGLDTGGSGTLNYKLQLYQVEDILSAVVSLGEIVLFGDW